LNIIRELSSISEYQPTKGDLLTLYRLAEDPTITRKEAVKHFKKSSSYFRNTYKILKDKLIEGVLTYPIKELNKKQKIEIQIWKKYSVFLILSSANKRNATIKIGEELIVIVERRGFFGIALEVSRKLETIYSAAVHKKYLKYKEKIKIFKKLLTEEQQMLSFNNELIFRVRSKKDISTLLTQLPILDKIVVTNEQYKFRLYYYNAYYYIHQLNNDVKLLLKNNEAAIAYCTSTKVFVPQQAIAYLYFLAIPINILDQNFAKAELANQKYMDQSLIGDNNWNVALQYKAVIGFQKDNPQVSANAFLQLNSIPNLQQTTTNKARWHVIHAFLYLYYVVGKIQSCEPFKLHKFLNEIAIIKNDSLISNSYVLELLHLLVANNQRVYQQRAEGIEQYISRNLKGNENNRVKYFMRMLRSVAVGGFHPVRVETHAKKNKAKLQKTPKSLHLVDTEIVPYDKLWEIVLLILSAPTNSN